MNVTPWTYRLLVVCLFLTGKLEGQSLNFNAVVPSSTQAVFQVDVPYPTADKPQSKLWYMEGAWWTILPTSTGPSLWKRGRKGWEEKKNVRKSLATIPGRADVWANEDAITAVSVDPKELVVFRLIERRIFFRKTWDAEILARLHPPVGEGEIETATIAQDKAGNWWVAADFGDKVCVWNADQNCHIWSSPIVLADGINDDDISLIAVMPEGIGVVWSDQNRQSVRMRIHLDGDSIEDWSEIVTIEEGNRTADDHLNSALSADGTLWLVSKNGVDLEGKSQFVLRVRSPGGNWTNYPYANMNPSKLPSRPIIVTSEDPSKVVSAHSVYDSKNPYLGEIVFGLIDTTSTDILTKVTSIVSPDTTGWVGVNRVNDVTGPKRPFKMGVPWILLCSDKDGRVYELNLTMKLEDR
ncbi:hypothetical protein [Lunatibacter salilacus]|uniref:hypothetical protein n=1 Tax=Lunatibacter salilacus TaxID=2483804 RepID=UPI00131AA017|nr:hypothetical protein [Lunatibacter salilacus]